MANARGSGGGRGRGDVAGGHGCQALLASVHAPPHAPRDHHLQLRHSVIHAPPMPPSLGHLRMHAPPPPPVHHHCTLPGSYEQAGSASNNTAPPQFLRGFADWRMHNSAFMTLAQSTAACGSSNSFFHHNMTAATWSNFMLPGSCCSYAMAYEGHRDVSYHNSSLYNDSATYTSFAPTFGVAPSALQPASAFPAVSPTSNNCTCMQILQESMYGKPAENSEDSLRVFGSSEMEAENNDELDHSPKFNCREYRPVLRKELTNSDVGNIGRIVLPKRDAEANLPPLFERDGIILQMDDLELPISWRFKYRFWPNNKSRMYILENTGEFVKAHALQAGDVLIIYKSFDSGRFIIRGAKATQQTAPIHLFECDCKKEGFDGQRCGFAMGLQYKRT